MTLLERQRFVERALAAMEQLALEGTQRRSGAHHQIGVDDLALAVEAVVCAVLATSPES